MINSLTKQSELFEALVEKSNDALFLTDTIEYKIQWCNRKSVDLFEVDSKEDLLGQLGEQFNADEISDDIRNDVKHELATQNLYRSVFRYQTRKGNLFWGLFETKCITIDNIQYQMVRVIDISENPGSWSIDLYKDLKSRSFNHLIKNNLFSVMNMIHLQIQTSTGTERSEIALQEVSRRIKTVAVLHEQLAYSKDNTHVDIRTYLEQLVSRISEINLGLQVRTTLEIPTEISAAPELMLKVGMIVNELVSNSCKHSFGINSYNSLSLSLEEKDSNCYLFYADNGKVNSDFQIAKFGGLGHQIIEAMIADLKADWNFEFSDEGFRAVLAWKM